MQRRRYALNNPELLWKRYKFNNAISYGFSDLPVHGLGAFVYISSFIPSPFTKAISSRTCIAPAV